MKTYPFYQIDVFGDGNFSGNPLAVVLDAGDLDTVTMQRIAAWTGLSETTFVTEYDRGQPAYTVRIFTQRRELPFAGHPTLGTCTAWMTHHDLSPEVSVMQQCLAGPVEVRPIEGGRAFLAPPLRRTGELDATTRTQIAQALRLPSEALRATQWVDNGSGWCAVLLDDVKTVLALEPDFETMGRLKVGVAAPCTDESREGDLEVRAFAPSEGVPEDPVTGNLQAGLAWWLVGTGRMPSSYLARQGTALNRRGRVPVRVEGEEVWIGGRTEVCVAGEIRVG